MKDKQTTGREIKKNQKPKICNGLMWAYFSPKGHVQVRSISHTRKEARESIVSKLNDDITYKDYERSGFVLHKIKIKVTPQLNSK